MATNRDFVTFLEEQLADAGEVKARAMFGEFGMHCNGKFFSLICGNKFYIKPTEAGRSFIREVVEAPPYPGAKNYFLIEEKLEDRDWMCELVKRTVSELPEPKKRRKK